MRVLTTREVAEMLQVSRDTVVRMIESGLLPAERLTPTGRRRVKEDDLRKYAEQNHVDLYIKAQ